MADKNERGKGDMPEPSTVRKAEIFFEGIQDKLANAFKNAVSPLAGDPDPMSVRRALHEDPGLKDYDVGASSRGPSGPGGR